VSPYLIVAGAQRVVDFLRRAFDGQKLRRFERPDGAIIHTEVRIGDTIVMLADAGEGWPPIQAHLHVYVENVDATYGRALDAGAEPVQPPERKADDPDRRGGVRDPAGNGWWIATQVG
jgi:PhnB protein